MNATIIENFYVVKDCTIIKQKVFFNFIDTVYNYVFVEIIAQPKKYRKKNINQ